MSDRSDNAISAVGGIAAGWASYKYLPPIIAKPYGRWFMTECKNITRAEHNSYWNAAQEALVSSGLKDKGVTLVDVNSSNLEKVIKDTFEKSDKFAEEVTEKLKLKNKSVKPSAPKARPKWKYILFGPDSNTKLKNKLKIISEGGNAGYHGASKNVLVNKDYMGFSTFHEMGHAVNATSKGALKALSVGRHATALAMPFLLATALIKRRKPESPNESKQSQRRKNFLKDNIGLISFGCMLPTVIEEGMASINGAKLAKNVLKPQELKKLNITNAKAWGTYLLSATLLSVFAQFAVKVKDKLVPPKENVNSQN